MRAFQMRLEQAMGSGAALALLCAPACSESNSGGLRCETPEHARDRASAEGRGRSYRRLQASPENERRSIADQFARADHARGRSPGIGAAFGVSASLACSEGPRG